MWKLGEPGTKLESTSLIAAPDHGWTMCGGVAVRGGVVSVCGGVWECEMECRCVIEGGGGEEEGILKGNLKESVVEWSGVK